MNGDVAFSTNTPLTVQLHTCVHVGLHVHGRSPRHYAGIHVRLHHEPAGVKPHGGQVLVVRTDGLVHGAVLLLLLLLLLGGGRPAPRG